MKKSNPDALKIAEYFPFAEKEEVPDKMTNGIDEDKLRLCKAEEERNQIKLSELEGEFNEKYAANALVLLFKELGKQETPVSHEDAYKKIAEACAIVNNQYPLRWMIYDNFDTDDNENRIYIMIKHVVVISKTGQYKIYEKHHNALVFSKI